MAKHLIWLTCHSRRLKQVIVYVLVLSMVLSLCIHMQTNNGNNETHQHATQRKYPRNAQLRDIDVLIPFMDNNGDPMEEIELQDMQLGSRFLEKLTDVGQFETAIRKQEEEDVEETEDGMKNGVNNEVRAEKEAEEAIRVELKEVSTTDNVHETKTVTGKKKQVPKQPIPGKQSPEPAAKIVVYSFYPSPGTGGRFTCLPLATNPTAPICLYSDEQDPRVSTMVRSSGLWQPLQVKVFQLALSQDPELGVIDIGANIGQFSLIAASSNRDVLAVEPYSEHLRRFHKAVAMSDMQQRIVALQNVISDRRSTVSLSVNSNHLAQVVPLGILKDENAPRAHVIHMDDILPYVRFHKVVIVMDTNVLPHKVLAKAQALFDKIKVNYIFMNWTRVRFYLQHDYHEHVPLITAMVSMLLSRGLVAYDMKSMSPLVVENSAQWPDLVIWLQARSKMVHSRV